MNIADRGWARVRRGVETASFGQIC